LEHKYKNIFLDELDNHIRFTIFAVLLAAVIIFLMRQYIFPSYFQSTGSSEELFEGFFISHLFFAALTPAALFSIYKRSLWLGIGIAIITSSVTCTLSDIVFPYIGGLLLKYDMHFHVCIIEEPVKAWSFIIGGAFIGYFLSQYVRKLSRYTHTAHILLSSLAAGMYLITYGVAFLSLKALVFIPILIVSVLVPCVMNDIGIPSYIVSMLGKNKKEKKEILDSIHAEHHDHHH
jgi:hypothetical protein